MVGYPFRSTLGMLAFLIGLASASQAQEKLTFFRIGTGPSTETLYALGTAISAAISLPPGARPCDEGGLCGVPGLIAVAQSRSGSIEGIQDLRDGELESALVHSDIAYHAFHGTGPFRNRSAMRQLRVIADLTPVSAHVMVLKDSPVTDIRQLRKHNVAVGPRRSGSRRTAQLLLKTHGLDAANLTPHFLKPGPAIDALARGDIQAMILFDTPPASPVTDLVARYPIRLLPLSGNELRTMLSLFPFLRPAEIPADTYQGIPATPTLELGVQWVVRADTPAELVADMTRALWSGATRDEFIRNNPQHAFPSPKDGKPDGALPIHEGAVEFYKKQD